jgi:hypothetical protein
MTFVCYHYSRASLHVRGERVHLVTSHLLFVWPLRSFLPRLFTSHDIRSTPAQCKYLDFLHHVAAMLSFPDRQRKFEQLRARWEAAETGTVTSMVGRREKRQPHQIINMDLQHDAGSKFRRNLSHGIALFSLQQRKVVSGRQLSSNASLAVSAPSTNDSFTTNLDHGTLLPPQIDSAPVHNLNDLHLSEESARVSEDVQTPRQLPRSRTFSYIPRPVKIDAEEQSVVESSEATEPSLGAVMTGARPLPLSRIPTPSPPQTKRRVSSPRQYLPHHPPLQAKTAANRKSLIGTRNGSSTEAAVRSRTTPNLLKATSTSQSLSHMAPRKPELKRPFGSSTPQKPVLAENVPTSKRVAQRRSQIQEKPIKRESLAVPSASPNRKSFGPGTLLA